MAAVGGGGGGKKKRQPSAYAPAVPRGKGGGAGVKGKQYSKYGTAANPRNTSAKKFNAANAARMSPQEIVSAATARALRAGMPVKASNKGLGITRNEAGPRLQKAINQLGYPKAERIVQGVVKQHPVEKASAGEMDAWLRQVNAKTKGRM